MRIVDPDTGVLGEHVMVPMRDGVRLSTFVYLPKKGTRFPVIVQRTPYGISSEHVMGRTDPALGWLPDPAKPMLGALLRGWKAIAARGYAVVYQDCRGRHDSEGVDRVYADDAADGFDTLDWIAGQSWCNGAIGIAGSSAAATTALAAASQRHPALKCFWAQVGGSSIYDDVVYEGGALSWSASGYGSLVTSPVSPARTVKWSRPASDLTTKVWRPRSPQRWKRQRGSRPLRSRCLHS